MNSLSLNVTLQTWRLLKSNESSAMNAIAQGSPIMRTSIQSIQFDLLDLSDEARQAQQNDALNAEAIPPPVEPESPQDGTKPDITKNLPGVYSRVEVYADGKLYRTTRRSFECDTLVLDLPRPKEISVIFK